MKGQKPVVKEKRLKMFVFGEAGVGKTLQALQFPQAYIIDTERGTDFYAKTINEKGSLVLQSLNSDEVKEEIRELLTTKHDFRTLIIDPVTQIYNACQEKWTRIFEKYAKTVKDKETQDFGLRYWQKVKADFKGLQRLLLALDMNVIVTAHQKDVYGNNFNKIGVTWDSMRGDDYFFDIIFRIIREGDKRVAITVKERADLGSNRFPERFEWTYENFCKFYGKEIIEKESTPKPMATAKQVTRVKQLVETVKIEDEEIDKWFLKADVDSWEEMTSEQIGKCVAFLEKKLKQATGGEEKPAKPTAKAAAKK